MKRQHAENLAWDIHREYADLQVRVVSVRPDMEDYGYILMIDGQKITSPTAWRNIENNYAPSPLPPGGLIEEFRAFFGIPSPETEGEEATTKDAEKLRLRRRVLGLTQAQLAERIGFHPNALARWERGELRIEHPEMLWLALDAIEAKISQPTIR